MSKYLDDSIDDISTNDIGGMSISEDVIGREEEMTSSEKKCTSCEQKVEHNMNIKTDEIGHNSASNDADTTVIVSADVVSGTAEVSLCANCGKEGASNTCNKCNQVMYCNAACKKRHRKKHKKDCEERLRRVAKLQEEENKRAAELHDIELFRSPPRKEDCPICFLLLPTLNSGWRYKSCCGKEICSGCIHAVQKADGFIGLCPFCRAPTPERDKEIILRLRKRVDIGDAEAMFSLGKHYTNGMHGLPTNHAKALELWTRAAELGHVEAICTIGIAYEDGRGVDKDEKKAMHYYELAAMRGCAVARYMLGDIEDRAGNEERAIKHYMIAVGGGCCYSSLKSIQKLYSNGQATKDEYTKALQAYQQYLDEVKSNQRDVAAMAREDYKYID